MPPGTTERSKALTPVRWRILGPIVGVRDEVPVTLAARHQRALLALLLSRVGERVSLTRIVQTLWGGEPPATAVNVVHKHVGVLRRVVEPGLPKRAQGSWLLSDAGGYRVVGDENSLDLLQFRALASRARRLSNPGRRLDAFEAALSLWRGPVAQDVTGEWGLDPAIEAIHGELAAAVTEAAEDALRLARGEGVLAALKFAASIHPTDEAVHAALMRCLASVGQRAAAIQTFASLRDLLSRQLGVLPGPELITAYVEVLRDQVSVATRARQLPIPRQLPARPASFVGREVELANLSLALRAESGSSSVSLITGTAGVGKTTLAVEVAHAVSDAFPDGQLYVDLRGFGTEGSALTPHSVLGHFLTALDLPQDRIPHDLEARAALYRSAVADLRLLVMLDNARETAQIAPLLTGAGPTRTVVTSRLQLRGLTTAGLHVVSLDLFSTAVAERFLRSRLSDQRVEREPEATNRLITLSGRLPLALSLFAARAAHSSSLPLADLASAVHVSRTALGPFPDQSDPRTDPRSVLSWSVDALSPQARGFFTLLGGHPGSSISSDQAAEIAGLGAEATRRLLDELVEASIVTEQRGGRIWRHDLLRQFSAELFGRLDPATRREARGRLYEHMTRSAAAASIVFSPNQVRPTTLPDLPADAARPGSWAEAAAWFDAEHETISLMITEAPAPYDRDPRLWHLAWAVENYLDGRSLWHQSLAVHEAGLTVALRADDVYAQLAMRRGTARAKMFLGFADQASEELRLAVDAFDRHPTASVPPEALRWLAWALSEAGDLPGALDAARRTVALFPANSRALEYAFALNSLGHTEALLGMYDQALAHCMEALTLQTGSAHARGLANVWGSLGLIHSGLSQARLAVHAYRRAYTLFRDMDAQHMAAHAAVDLAGVLRDAGRIGAARRLLESALQTFEALGSESAAAVSALLDGLGPADPGCLES
jgi:DNA-binding SARP family transcriptional activator/tetratricopeptide (TPR) repeat protein